MQPLVHPGGSYRFRHPDLLDESGRIAGYYRHGRHIAGDDAVRADNRAIADPHAGKDGGAYADPYLVLDDDRFPVRGAPIIGVRIVVDRDEIHFRGDKYVVAYGDAAAVEESASLLYPASFADADVLAEIHIEQRQ